MAPQLHERLHLHLAGSSPAATRGNESLPLAPLDAALLGWLAVEGPTDRTRLAHLLWPKKDAEAARNSLRQRLFQLRRQFQGDLLEGTTLLGLAAGVTHDLDEAAPLHGDAPPAAEGEYADWLLQGRRQRLARRRRALDAAVDQAERVADWPTAAQHAQALVALEPLSEAAHRRLMRVHYLAGDRGAALLAFDQCEQLLRDELGARPSQASLDLLALVQASDRSLPVAPALSVAPAAVLRPPRLVGRDAEWQALQRAWDRLQPICVVGEAGLGKSRLVADFAQSQGRTLLTGARPGDAGVVYGSASRLLRAVPRAALAALEPGARGELARLLPELGPASADSLGVARVRFFNAVATALAHPAAGLLGVVFEDLHFADDASVELLQFLCGGSPLRWLLTSRPSEGGPAATALLAGLGEDKAHCTLAPLDLPQVRQLLHSLDIAGLDATAGAGAWYRHSGGNPLFLLETLKAWLAGGGASADAGLPPRLPAAPSVASMITRRIGHLSPRAIELVRCAAIATPDFGIELAAAVLGLRTIQLAEPWAELEAAQVLRDDAFAHDLIHESALASVPAPVARQLHAEVAAYLEAHGGAPARVARHWLSAEREAQAVDALVRAADAAKEAWRRSEEVSLRDQASTIAERLGRRHLAFEQALQAAQALQVVDRNQHSADRVARLLALADTDAQRNLASLQRLQHLLFHGHYATVLDEAVELAHAADTSGGRHAQVEALIHAAQAATYLDRHAHAVQLMRQALRWTANGDVTDPRLQLEVASSLALMLDNVGELAEAADFHRQALQLAMERGWRGEAALVASNQAINMGDRGRRLEALNKLDEARRLAAEVDQADGAQWVGELMRFNYLRDIGRLELALEAAGRAATLAGQHPQVDTLLRIGESLLWLRLGQGARAQQSLRHVDGTASALTAARLAQQQARLSAWLGQDTASAWRNAARQAEGGLPALVAMIELEAAPGLPWPDGLARCEAVLDRMAPQGYEGVALVARLIGCTLAQSLGEQVLALQWARAAAAAPPDVCAEDLDPVLRWLAPARVLLAQGLPGEARAQALAGEAWVRATAMRLPEAFRAAFVERVPANRELLALVTRLG